MVRHFLSLIFVPHEWNRSIFAAEGLGENMVTVPSVAPCAACDCFQTLEGALDLKKQKRLF